MGESLVRGQVFPPWSWGMLKVLENNFSCASLANWNSDQRGPQKKNTSLGLNFLWSFDFKWKLASCQILFFFTQRVPSFRWLGVGRGDWKLLTMRRSRKREIPKSHISRPFCFWWNSRRHTAPRSREREDLAQLFGPIRTPKSIHIYYKDMEKLGDLWVNVEIFSSHTTCKNETCSKHLSVCP